MLPMAAVAAKKVAADTTVSIDQRANMQATSRVLGCRPYKLYMIKETEN